MRGFNFSKRRLLFSAAAIGIGALALSNSDLLDHEQDNPKTSQALVDTVGPKDTQGAEIAAGPVVKFAPSEGVQQRLDDVHAQLSGTAEEYGVFHGRLRGDVSESDRAQAQSMLDRLDVLNAELNEANASLVEEFIGFVDAHAQDGYVLIDFYDEECNACQDLDENLEGIVPLQRMKKREKDQLFEKFKEGDSHQVTVQEVDEEYKKIILMIDLELEITGIEDAKETETVDIKVGEVEADPDVQFPHEVRRHRRIVLLRLPAVDQSASSAGAAHARLRRRVEGLGQRPGGVRKRHCPGWPAVAGRGLCRIGARQQRGAVPDPQCRG